MSVASVSCRPPLLARWLKYSTFKSLGTVTPSLSLVDRIRVSGACTILCSSWRGPSLNGVNSAVSCSCLKPVGESAFGMFATVRSKRLERLECKILGLRVEGRSDFKDYIFCAYICFLYLRQYRRVDLPALQIPCLDVWEWCCRNGGGASANQTRHGWHKRPAVADCSKGGVPESAAASECTTRPSNHR
jgi:hypothetical protein